MSGKPPKWRPNKLQKEESALKREKTKLIQEKNDLYMKTPKEKMTPEVLRKYIAERREKMEEYDKQINEINKKLQETEKAIVERKENIAKHGISTLRRGGKNRKTRRTRVKKS